MKVTINTSFGSNGTIKTLSEILQKRMEYMNETARDSVAAMAINVLKSIRPITKVAKKSTIKVEVTKEGGLFPSITSYGQSKKLCLRTTGTNARYTGPETLIGCEKVPLKTQHVFRFIDEYSKNRRQYLIVAPNIGVAKRRAKQIAERRGMRYSGLAKRAIGILMYKTNTKRVNDGTLNPLVENTANSVTRKSERVNKKGDAGTYTLTLSDNLRYALKAIKGGKTSFDVQMRKAANKIVSIINQKIKGDTFFGPKKLDTPFPEVKQRKGK